MLDPNLINPQQRLVRIQEGKLISGVCIGISLRYRLPLDMVRFAFIILSIVTGLVGGVVLYIILVSKLPLISLNLSLPGDRPIAPTKTLWNKSGDLVREWLPLSKDDRGDKLAVLILVLSAVFVLAIAITGYLGV
jgi:phage shock protein PspC (stress-responsive transcriptional regulator)